MSMLLTQINAGLVVLIWLVQIIIYPGMHGWDHSRFESLHRAYCRRIALIVGPLMPAQAVLAFYQLAVVGDFVTLTQVMLICLVAGVTVFISMPLHRRLSGGYDAEAVNRLIRTNWLRTAGWSLVWLLDWLG